LSVQEKIQTNPSFAHCLRIQIVIKKIATVKSKDAKTENTLSSSSYSDDKKSFFCIQPFRNQKQHFLQERFEKNFSDNGQWE